MNNKVEEAGVDRKSLETIMQVYTCERTAKREGGLGRNSFRM